MHGDGWATSFGAEDRISGRDCERRGHVDEIESRKDALMAILRLDARGEREARDASEVDRGSFDFPPPSRDCDMKAIHSRA